MDGRCTTPTSGALFSRPPSVTALSMPGRTHARTSRHSNQREALGQPAVTSDMHEQTGRVTQHRPRGSGVPGERRRRAGAFLPPNCARDSGARREGTGWARGDAGAYASRSIATREDEEGVAEFLAQGAGALEI